MISDNPTGLKHSSPVGAAGTRVRGTRAAADTTHRRTRPPIQHEKSEAHLHEAEPELISGSGSLWRWPNHAHSAATTRGKDEDEPG